MAALAEALTTEKENTRAIGDLQPVVRLVRIAVEPDILRTFRGFWTSAGDGSLQTLAKGSSRGGGSLQTLTTGNGSLQTGGGSLQTLTTGSSSLQIGGGSLQTLTTGNGSLTTGGGSLTAGGMESCLEENGVGGAHRWTFAESASDMERGKFKRVKVCDGFLEMRGRAVESGVRKVNRKSAVRALLDDSSDNSVKEVGIIDEVETDSRVPAMFGGASAIFQPPPQHEGQEKTVAASKTPWVKSSTLIERSMSLSKKQKRLRRKQQVEEQLPASSDEMEMGADATQHKHIPRQSRNVESSIQPPTLKRPQSMAASNGAADGSVKMVKQDWVTEVSVSQGVTEVSVSQAYDATQVTLLSEDVPMCSVHSEGGVVCNENDGVCGEGYSLSLQKKVDQLTSSEDSGYVRSGDWCGTCRALDSTSPSDWPSSSTSPFLVSPATPPAEEEKPSNSIFDDSSRGDGCFFMNPGLHSSLNHCLYDTKLSTVEVESETCVPSVQTASPDKGGSVYGDSIIFPELNEVLNPDLLPGAMFDPNELVLYSSEGNGADDKAYEEFGAFLESGGISELLKKFGESKASEGACNVDVNGLCQSILAIDESVNGVFHSVGFENEESPAGNVATVVTVASEEIEPVKKKRGRPRKRPLSPDSGGIKKAKLAGEGKKRGRPRKIPPTDSDALSESKEKRKRGRPRKLLATSDALSESEDERGQDKLRKTLVTPPAIGALNKTMENRVPQSDRILQRGEKTATGGICKSKSGRIIKPTEKLVQRWAYIADKNRRKNAKISSPQQEDVLEEDQGLVAEGVAEDVVILSQGVAERQGDALLAKQKLLDEVQLLDVLWQSPMKEGAALLTLNGAALDIADSCVFADNTSGDTNKVDCAETCLAEKGLPGEQEIAGGLEGQEFTERVVVTEENYSSTAECVCVSATEKVEMVGDVDWSLKDLGSGGDIVTAVECQQVSEKEDKCFGDTCGELVGSEAVTVADCKQVQRAVRPGPISKEKVPGVAKKRRHCVIKLKKKCSGIILPISPQHRSCEGRESAASSLSSGIFSPPSVLTCMPITVATSEKPTPMEVQATPPAMETTPAMESAPLTVQTAHPAAPPPPFGESAQVKFKSPVWKGGGTKKTKVTESRGKFIFRIPKPSLSPSPDESLPQERGYVESLSSPRMSPSKSRTPPVETSQDGGEEEEDDCIDIHAMDDDIYATDVGEEDPLARIFPAVMTTLR